MVLRPDTSGPKLRTRKKKSQLPYPMPDLFVRAIHEWFRRASTQSFDDHLSHEQRATFATTAWENAGSDTKEHFSHLAAGFPGSQSRMKETGPIGNDAHPPLRVSSARGKGKKASNRPRAKRAAPPPPPPVQVHPATRPSHDNLECTTPPTPHSTCSSVSIPLQEVVRSGGPSLSKAGGAPQAQRADGTLPPRMPPLPTDDFQRNEGASFEPHPSVPFASSWPIPESTPLGLGVVSGASDRIGTEQGLHESMDGGGVPVADVDSSLLDAQCQMRHQMLEFYRSMHPSLGYADMSSATEHWPWR
ncbi:hypothetical protein LXA43DRAFT_146932 [Ganoderma leucocontextum]|nr:hypothetical protein LXA43DRAFT_146932 [Ganoderma leucocontextum]